MSSIRVEVVYALPDGVDAVSVELPKGATARDAVIVSGMTSRHAGIDLGALGVFGKQVDADTPLADGDRVELYRPLAQDPKERRRQRAAARGKRSR